MQINELRIGNYINKGIVHWVGFDDGIQACGIMKNEFQSISETFKLDEIRPILLTDKWLIEFGFKNIGEKLYCKRWRLNRVDVYQMISGNYPFYFRFNQVDLKIKDVHQLQNLYFTLRLKELTIK